MEFMSEVCMVRGAAKQMPEVVQVNFGGVSLYFIVGKFYKLYLHIYIYSKSERSHHQFTDAKPNCC